MTDRLPAIIQAMQDAAHEAGDVVLASALALVASPAEVAPLLPLTGTDAMHGAGLYALTYDHGTTAANLGAADHALACRVAARLASTACLLLAIDAKDHHDAAGALWRAAAHLTSAWDRKRRGLKCPLCAGVGWLTKEPKAITKTEIVGWTA